MFSHSSLMCSLIQPFIPVLPTDRKSQKTMKFIEHDFPVGKGNRPDFFCKCVAFSVQQERLFYFINLKWNKTKLCD